jgi:hypothetical protein
VTSALENDLVALALSARVDIERPRAAPRWRGGFASVLDAPGCFAELAKAFGVKVD